MPKVTWASRVSTAGYTIGTTYCSTKLPEYAGAPEPILKWGEWADPAAQFQQGTPHDSGKVDPGDPAPAQGQSAAENHEDDERQVNENDEVGEGPEQHLDTMPHKSQTAA